MPWVRAVLIALSSLAFSVRIGLCHAEKIFDLEAGVAYDSNLPRAPEEADKASDTAATLRLSGGWRGAVGDRSGVSATAFARGAKFARFDGLDMVALGA